MTLISPELAKKQAKVDGNHQDDLILIYTNAAESSAIEFLNRRVFATQAELDAAVAANSAGAYPMVINDQIKAAILLTLTFLEKNRGDADEPMPSAAINLLQPFRKNMGI